MYVYKIYTNTGNHVARDSLLNDSYYKNTYNFMFRGFAQNAQTYSLILPRSQRARFCSRLADSGRTENRERSLHIVAQETIKLTVTGEWWIEVFTGV